MKLQTLLENQSTGTEFLKTEEEIEAWLEKYEVEDYEIHDDLTVTLNSDLNLFVKSIRVIPIKFKETKSIKISSNYLTSIDWAPEVVSGDFECNNNQITSLEGGPKEVHGTFDCEQNKLTSLEGGPKVVKGSYVCSNNNLGNLKGIADEVGASVDVSNCNLTSLEFLPSKIGANLFIDNNKITSFRGIYKVLKEINTCKSEYGGTIAFKSNHVEKGLISIMGIKGIRELLFTYGAKIKHPHLSEIQKAIDIINNSIKNNIDAITTQKLLADAGLMKYS